MSQGVAVLFFFMGTLGRQRTTVFLLIVVFVGAHLSEVRFFSVHSRAEKSLAAYSLEAQ